MNPEPEEAHNALRNQLFLRRLWLRRRLLLTSERGGRDAGHP